MTARVSIWLELLGSDVETGVTACIDEDVLSGKKKTAKKTVLQI